MIRQLMVLLCLFVIGACAKSQGIANNAEDSSPPALPDNYFSQFSECADAWRSLFVEWERAGGGVRHSIQSAKQQISLDRKSRLADIIRKTWALQTSEGRNGLATWSWPIPDKELHRILGYFYSAIGDGVPDHCRYFDFAGSNLWWETRGGKPVEAPAALQWEPSRASFWLGYWMFIRPADRAESASNKTPPNGL